MSELVLGSFRPVHRPCYPPLTAAIYFNYESGILYWDGSRLQVGFYTPENGLVSASGAAVGYDKVIFTRFGSVVGFTNNNVAWGTGKVVFNPVSPGGNYATYSNIPWWNGATSVEGYVSTTLHTAPNVQAGYGDICKLAGQTASGARTNIDNGTWRLPTDYENQLFVGHPALYNFLPGSPNYGSFEGGRALPALGARYTDGSPNCWGTVGCYWGSTADDENPYGHNLTFNSDNVYPSETSHAQDGRAIRCVRQNTSDTP